jgi:hypothetical protein
MDSLFTNLSKESRVLLGVLSFLASEDVSLQLLGVDGSDKLPEDLKFCGEKSRYALPIDYIHLTHPKIALHELIYYTHIVSTKLSHLFSLPNSSRKSPNPRPSLVLPPFHQNSALFSHWKNDKPPSTIHLHSSTMLFPNNPMRPTRINSTNNGRSVKNFSRMSLRSKTIS